MINHFVDMDNPIMNQRFTHRASKYNVKQVNVIKNSYQKLFHGLCKRHFNYITSPIRVLPDFFVIGVVRSGTTSLFHYLGQHPNIRRASYDELGYFDDNFHLGLNWYRSLFPTKFTKQNIEKKFKKFLTFDVTPFYIYNPLVINRILDKFPKAKIIANLRNPIDRAYSNYNQAMQDNCDTETTFEEIVTQEIDIIEKKKIDLDNPEKLVNEFYELLLSRGLYAAQLEPWFKTFPSNQILTVSSEELSKNTQNTLKQIFQFLEIPNSTISDLTKQNVRKVPPMKDETRKLLIEYYKPYNEKLYKLVNKRFDWDK